jgi:peroxiredoxin Q/BCP
MPALAVGDVAPPFTAVLQDGSTFDSASVIGKKAVVLFFYPKDHTPVCTKEACAFRDAYSQFVDAGCEVIGVSCDSAARHERFADRHRLPYPLATDADGSLRRAFGMKPLLGFLPGRTTFVIDRDGIVRLVFSALFASDEHVKKALDVLGQAG